MNDAALQHGNDPRDVYPWRCFSSNRQPGNTFFDPDGKPLRRKFMTSGAEFESRVEFIVLPTGDCVSTTHGEWNIVAFCDNVTNEEVLAPARPHKIFRDEHGQWVVDFYWIKSDADYDAMENKHGDARDIFEFDNTLLSLQAIQGSTRLFHFESLSLPNYQKTFPMFHKWCAGRVHQDIGFWTSRETKNMDYVGIDVYDVLEFYFAEPQLLGRTRLGEWMWKHLLEPQLGQNRALATRLLGADTFTVVDPTCAQGTQCVWCGGANATVCARCDGDFCVDQSCLVKTRLFFDVGVFMRHVRSHKQFSPQCVQETQDFVAQLCAKTQSHKKQKI